MKEKMHGMLNHCTKHGTETQTNLEQLREEIML